MGNNFREALEEELKNEEFRLEYEALKPEYDVVKAVLEARQQAELRRCIMGKAVSSGIVDYDREYIEQKLDEADRTAKESDVRLSHDEVFSNARAIIYSEADKKESVNIRVKFRETDANGWIEIYDALDTLKWYSSEFHIEGNEELVELLNDISK